MKKMFLLLAVAVLVIWSGQAMAAGNDQPVLVFNVGEKLDLENQSYVAILLDKNFNAKIHGPVVAHMEGIYLVNKRGVLLAPPETAPNVEEIDIRIKKTQTGDVMVIPTSKKLSVYFGKVVNGNYHELRKLTL